MRYADPWDESARLESLLEADLVARARHTTLHVRGRTFRLRTDHVEIRPLPAGNRIEGALRALDVRRDDSPEGEKPH